MGVLCQVPGRCDEAARYAPTPSRYAPHPPPLAHGPVNVTKAMALGEG